MTDGALHPVACPTDVTPQDGTIAPQAGSVLPCAHALGRLVPALDEEALIRAEDVLVVREGLTHSLSLLLAVAQQREAAAVDFERTPPVVIVGFPRTGTTFLQTMLSRHPGLHSPQLWELLYPVEAHSGNPWVDARVQRATEHYVADYHRRAPDVAGIHPIAARRPDECHRLLAHTFHSYVFELSFRVPSYGDWLAGQDLTRAYQWHRRLLDLLYAPSRTAPEPMPAPLLKCPFHTWALDALVRVYPQARLIQLHRNPVDVVASLASLSRAARAAYSDDVDNREIGDVWLRRVAAASRLLADDREGLLDNAEVLDVWYEDLIRDPMTVVEQVCRFAGLPFPRDLGLSIAEHLARSGSSGRPQHLYRPEDFGLTAGGIERGTAAYSRRFGV